MLHTYASVCSCASPLVSGLGAHCQERATDQVAMGGAHHKHLGSALTTGSDVAGWSHSRTQGSGSCSEESPLRPSGPTQPRWVSLSPGPGMWRWSLHKKMERNPGKSSVLVRILLRELEKVGAQVRGRQQGWREEPPQVGVAPVQICASKCGLFVNHMLDFPSLVFVSALFSIHPLLSFLKLACFKKRNSIT